MPIDSCTYDICLSIHMPIDVNTYRYVCLSLYICMYMHAIDI